MEVGDPSLVHAVFCSLNTSRWNVSSGTAALMVERTGVNFRNGIDTPSYKYPDPSTVSICSGSLPAHSIPTRTSYSSRCRFLGDGTNQRCEVSDAAFDPSSLDLPPSEVPVGAHAVSADDRCDRHGSESWCIIARPPPEATVPGRRVDRSPRRNPGQGCALHVFERVNAIPIRVRKRNCFGALQYRSCLVPIRPSQFRRDRGCATATSQAPDRAPRPSEASLYRG